MLCPSTERAYHYYLAVPISRRLRLDMNASLDFSAVSILKPVTTNNSILLPQQSCRE
jgi:hypothetical protein